MIIFEIKHYRRLLWLPEITPGGVGKGHPYFFPETYDTGKLIAFADIERAKQFFQDRGISGEAVQLEKIDLDRLKHWSENVELSDVDTQQLDSLYVMMIDYFSEIEKGLPEDFKYESLRQLNQQVVLRQRHEILTKAARENPEAAENVHWEQPSEETLQEILRKPELRKEAWSLIQYFEEIIEVR